MVLYLRPYAHQVGGLTANEAQRHFWWIDQGLDKSIDHGVII